MVFFGADKSGHQYGQNFYTNIRSFLLKLPKQFNLEPMELCQYLEVEVFQDTSSHLHLRDNVLPHVPSPTETQVRS